MDFVGVYHPFFLPRWRRILVTLLCSAWALFELLMGSVFWALLVGSLAVYLAWVLLLAFDAEKFKGDDAT